MTVSLSKIPLWDDGDEVMLNTLLQRRNRAMAQVEALTPREAMDSGMILMLEHDLNQKLRPEMRPLLSYARTPRLGLQLMADYGLEIYWWGSTVVEARWTSGVYHIASMQKYKSEPEKVKALGIAIADCVLKVLRFKEINNG